MAAFCSRRHSPATIRLSIERLESRQLLAGDVEAYVQGQMLVVWGDAADNGVKITYNSATKAYRIVGADAGGSPTTINGLDTSVPENVVELSGVKQVYVGLNGGHDTLEIGSPEAVDTVIAQWLSIEMGDGDDQVVLGAAGNEAGEDAPIATSLRTGTSLRVDLGAGNDDLSLANAEIGLALHIYAGDGDDDIHFDTEFQPSEDAPTQLFPVRVGGNALINLGGGEDELSIKHVLVRRSLAILDGAGPAHIELFNLNVSKTIDLATAHEADDIDIFHVRAKQLAINTNGGIDHLTLNNVVLTTLNIKLGSGRDHLRMLQTKTSLFAHINGDGSGAILSGSGNSLRGLWRRNVG
jgi:hypothetical protein